jgi:DNA-binding MarR family transcriptional regulator/GNAT superfamily N-acetyltransferase
MEEVVIQAEEFRGFNRFYTVAIGVLTDRYLGQARPLREARLLFEIGERGAAIRDLRTLLDLDAGYLSRLLQSLRRQGLVQVRSRPGDRRTRIAELTAQGLAELAEMNEQTTAIAAGLLAPLSSQQRAELIAAMGTVRRRLRLAAISIDIADPSSPAARQCLAEYADEIDQRFPAGFDRSTLVPAAEATGASGVFMIARERMRSVGCGVVRTAAPGVAEIHYVWVHADARRLGLGRRMLTELEQQAASLGLLVVRLATHAVLTEAISMYRAAGYREIPLYDDSPYAHHCFEKELASLGCCPAEIGSPPARIEAR